MKSKRGRLCLSAFLSIFISFWIISCKKESLQDTGHKVSPSSQLLKQVAEDYWDHLIKENIFLRFKLGLEINKLPDVTFDHFKSEADFSSSILERLKEVKPGELNHEQELSLDILKWENKNVVGGLKYFWLSFTVTPYTSPLPFIHRVFTSYKFEDDQDVNHYLDLLKKYPLLINDMKTKLEKQCRKGIILPKEEIALVIPFHNSFIKEGEKSLFYVKDERLGAIEKAKRKEFKKRIVDIVNTEVNTALKKLVYFIKGDYCAEASDAVGLWQYPNGKEYYKYLVRVNTTLDLSPQEIHQIGLDYVERNKAKLDKIREQVGFEGTIEEFRRFLQTDPRFFPKTPQEIGTELKMYVKAMEEKIDDYFLKKPKAPYSVERLAPELEGSMTFGYYEPPTAAKERGIYYYNGSKLEERSLLMAEGLIYHELLPGHHFQIASQYENEDLPNFRRYTLQNAFNEGWAEYASWLGVEMGLYKDPYSLCGRYFMDTFLSTRLVVDTGMNYLEWPRSKAEKFMKENLLKSATQIHTETLRYSVDMPAQALAYKLGSLKMFELRDRTEKALGDRFDVRKYHDAIISSGSLPLPILEKHINWFIKKELGSSAKF